MLGIAEAEDGQGAEEEVCGRVELRGHQEQEDDSLIHLFCPVPRICRKVSSWDFVCNGVWL